MPGIDDNIRSELERLGRPADPHGAFEAVRSRKNRLRLTHRAQVAALVVLVLAGTGSGTYALARLFGDSKDLPASLGPPGNGAIAFTQTVGHSAVGPDDTEIFEVNPATGSTRRLTDYSGFDWAPSWSPDGTRLAFARGTLVSGGATSGMALHQGIFVMDPNGSHVHQITGCPNLSCRGDDSAPAWSPDGRRLAFVRGADIWTIASGGSRAVTLCQRCAHGYGISRLAWSPDGKQVVFSFTRFGPVTPTTFDPIMTVDVATGQVRTLTKCQGCPGASRDSSPAWSPDGRTLVFVRVIQGVGHLLAMNPDGLAVRDLVDCPDPGGSGTCDGASFPTWSPDGTQIAFIASRVAAPRHVASALYVMDANGAHVRKVPNTDGIDSGLSWQPVFGLPSEPSPSGESSPSRPPSPSPTPSESVEPTPSTTPTGDAPFVGYVCGEGSTISADFDGDGSLDTAMVHHGAIFDFPPPCPSPPPGTVDTSDWKIDVKWGNGVAGSWPLPECDTSCSAYSAFDLDGNGTAEFALVVQEGASTTFLNFFELPPEEPGPILFAEASQSTALELAIGGSVTHLDFVTCQTDGSGASQLVATSAGLSQDGSTWDLTETVYAFDPSAPAGGDPRTADAFSVASTNTSTQPADPNGDPPTVNGSRCFVPEGS